MKTQKYFTLIVAKTDTLQGFSCSSYYFSNKLLKQNKQINADNNSPMRHFCFESKVMVYTTTFKALENNLYNNISCKPILFFLKYYRSYCLSTIINRSGIRNPYSINPFSAINLKCSSTECSSVSLIQNY